MGETQRGHCAGGLGGDSLSDVDQMDRKGCLDGTKNPTLLWRSLVGIVSKTQRDVMAISFFLVDQSVAGGFFS